MIFLEGVDGISSEDIHFLDGDKALTFSGRTEASGGDKEDGEDWLGMVEVEVCAEEELSEVGSLSDKDVQE